MRYVALLRGIAPMNPNHRNEKLRGVLEGLGLRNVTSVISSGNVIFDADSGSAARLEAMIEAAWPERLGFTSTTILRSRDELERLIEADPFRGRDDAPSGHLNVTFLKHPPAVEVSLPFRPENGGYEITAVLERAVCSAVSATGAPTSDLMRWMERTYGRQITTRTWKTVHRIVARMA